MKSSSDSKLTHRIDKAQAFPCQKDFFLKCSLTLCDQGREDLSCRDSFRKTTLFQRPQIAGCPVRKTRFPLGTELICTIWETRENRETSSKTQWLTKSEIGWMSWSGQPPQRDSVEGTTTMMETLTVSFFSQRA